MSAAHTPRPAHAAATHPEQRYFSETRAVGGVYAVPTYTDRARARVYRYASDLLDAAHDIEQHPAATLCPQPAQEVAA